MTAARSSLGGAIVSIMPSATEGAGDCDYRDIPEEQSTVFERCSMVLEETRGLVRHAVVLTPITTWMFCALWRATCVTFLC